MTEVPRILDDEIDGPLIWTGAGLPSESGAFRLTDTCLSELDDLLEVLRVNPLPLAVLTPDDFELPQCRGLMAEVDACLTRGVGFALIDRLPLDRWSREEATMIYWLLSSMIARPVAQNWEGKLIYDIRDTGRKPGNGVRPDVTNVSQNFHTDNSYNLCPPWYVALFCLQTAKEGGVSSIVSFYAAHNEMRRRHPELLTRLYENYVFDRQREHAPDDVMTLRHPMFEFQEDRLIARLSRFQVVNGQKLAEEPLDDLGRRALEAFEAIIEEPGMAKDFFFEPGQIQIVDNRRCGHRRSGFQDWPEPARKRHLIRLWLRGSGRAFYNG